MIVTLLKSDCIHSISLPEKVGGQYWIMDEDAQRGVHPFMGIEESEGVWMLKSNAGAAVLDKAGGDLPHTILDDNCFYTLRDRKTGDLAQLVTEPVTGDRQRYAKYLPRRNCTLTIGRGSDNRIAIHSDFVSTHHAKLSYTDGVWNLQDCGSKNGVFVNERRISETELHPGDTVYIMGFKMMIGSDFLALNNPDGSVTVAEGALYPYSEQTACVAAPEQVPEFRPALFYRSPRFCRAVSKADVKVDPPPQPEKMEEVPLALLLGPAMTMGMTALIMGGMAVNNLLTQQATLVATIPSLAMSFSMLCGTLLWPMLTKKNEKKRKGILEEKRRQRYRNYLDEMRESFFDLGRTQSEILHENNVAPAVYAKRILERQPALWERTMEQEDFLTVRLGVGDLPLSCDIHYPDKRFSMEDDCLQNDLYRLAGEEQILKDVPITYSLRQDAVSGITGPRERVLELAQSMVLQLAALHSYDELKLVFLIEESELKRWEFVKWLPHTWDANGTLRLISSDSDSCKGLSAHLERVMAGRMEAKDKKVYSPHYVVFLTNQELVRRTDVMGQLLQSGKDYGFSVVSLVDQLSDLPKECSKVVELEREPAIYQRNDASGHKTVFSPDDMAGLDLHALSCALANTALDLQQGQAALPNMLTFLEMYHVGKTEHLNALTRWKENSPINTLRAPVGIAADGEPAYLDLHEKIHGPHGLVAGMTGSGKSEFIITYILSMAVNYRPEEVAFILIDYKGGGLAGAFENAEKGIRLPHLAGTITNLDGAAVTRSLISIQSELRRRQAVFNEARRITDAGTMDIYKYQKLYRSGQVSEAVPHLFIISDEFAELKTQQPEFMQQLISAARIGRSLGVHLILATQKPAGVVDDQIWSNSRFRVCLKVQERADSMDMIKRPDAAELAETGRFYLQVGFNEFFELGQSAWCGAPYVPADKLEENRDESVAVIDRLGRVLAEAKPKRVKSETDTTQIVSIVSYLSQLADEEHFTARPLWLPAIPAVIYADDLAAKYGYQADPVALNPIIGEYDDPFNQKQALLTLPLSQEGNAVIFGAVDGGKTTLLNTMLYSLLSNYDASRLNLYLLDFETETLRAFENAPQVGDVMLSQDGEKIGHLLRMLDRELAQRKKLFSDCGGEFGQYCRSTGQVLPNIVVVIRNYAAFAEQYENYEEQLLRLSREGSKCGIYFILVSSTPNGVRYRMLQNFKQILVLQLNDRSDYVGLLGNTGGVYPSKIKGRGLVHLDKVYEFQTAYLGKDFSPEAIRTFCAQLDKNAQTHVAAVPILPHRVDARYALGQHPTLGALPVGVEKQSLAVARVDLAGAVVSLMLGQDPESLAACCGGAAELLMAMEDVTLHIWDGAALLSDKTYSSSHWEEAVVPLFDEMVRRNNTYKSTKNPAKTAEEYPRQVYLITGLQQILSALSEDGKDKLRTLLLKASPIYGIHVLLCQSIKDMGAIVGETWYQQQVRLGEGIWVGDGIAEQYVLKVTKLTNGLYAELPEGFGYVMHKGRPVLTKLIVTAAEGEE